VPHVQLDIPLNLEERPRLMRICDSATAFRDYGFAFEEAQRVNIRDELKQMLDDFGTQGLKAAFPVRHGIVEGWLDPLHNYVAIACTRTSGDTERCVLTTSISPSTAN
jgi:hypothetical protein